MNNYFNDLDENLKKDYVNPNIDNNISLDWSSIKDCLLANRKNRELPIVAHWSYTLYDNFINYICSCNNIVRGSLTDEEIAERVVIPRDIMEFLINNDLFHCDFLLSYIKHHVTVNTYYGAIVRNLNNFDETYFVVPQRNPFNCHENIRGSEDVSYKNTLKFYQDYLNIPGMKNNEKLIKLIQEKIPSNIHSRELLCIEDEELANIFMLGLLRLGKFVYVQGSNDAFIEFLENCDDISDVGFYKKVCEYCSDNYIGYQKGINNKIRADIVRSYCDNSVRVGNSCISLKGISCLCCYASDFLIKLLDSLDIGSFKAVLSHMDIFIECPNYDHSVTITGGLRKEIIKFLLVDNIKAASVDTLLSSSILRAYRPKFYKQLESKFKDRDVINTDSNFSSTESKNSSTAFGSMSLF